MIREYVHAVDVSWAPGSGEPTCFPSVAIGETPVQSLMIAGFCRVRGLNLDSPQRFEGKALDGDCRESARPSMLPRAMGPDDLADLRAGRSARC